MRALWCSVHFVCYYSSHFLNIDAITNCTNMTIWQVTTFHITFYAFTWLFIYMNRPYLRMVYWWHELVNMETNVHDAAYHVYHFVHVENVGLSWIVCLIINEWRWNSTCMCPTVFIFGKFILMTERVEYTLFSLSYTVNGNRLATAPWIRVPI